VSATTVHHALTAGDRAGTLTAMTSLSIMPLVADDLPFLRAMLYEAAFWRRTADAPSLAVALDDPALALYVRGWGRPGDEGLIARAGTRPVGAVWVRRFGAAEHGYGYVDERTPELSIAVADGHRGRGLGQCLLASMLAQLRLRGVAQVSLSVETDNPARHLYERLGFTRTQTFEGAVTMVRTLA
jgi:ribosomal protein S18 acetylase RimI-like enzyme